LDALPKPIDPLDNNKKTLAQRLELNFNPKPKPQRGKEKESIIKERTTRTARML
jgi:hypothetical protein